MGRRSGGERVFGRYGRRPVGRLAWLVVTDGSPNLTATFWEREEDPSQQQTTVFQLPSALGFEKAGHPGERRPPSAACCGGG